jgi:excisionase family DNA binding protein
VEQSVDDALLTVVDVARRLKIPVSTARQLVARSEIRGFKVGRNWRVLESELIAYIDAQRYKARTSSKPAAAFKTEGNPFR